MQVLDADRDQQQGRRCATEPTNWRPAPRTTALRRDGERPPGRLHRQAADCLSGLTKTVEAGAAFRTAGDMVINYFNDALPHALRGPQEELLGTAPRAYLIAGVSDIRFKGAVSGPQPDCGTVYETAVGVWLLTRTEASQSKLVAADGHLRGSYRDLDSPATLFEWDLAPLREP